MAGSFDWLAWCPFWRAKSETLAESFKLISWAASAPVSFGTPLRFWIRGAFVSVLANQFGFSCRIVAEAMPALADSAVGIEVNPSGSYRQLKN